MKFGRRITTPARALYFSSAVALLFFLIASAPHRVHHFFDQFPQPEDSQNAHAEAHDHGGAHDHDQKPAPASPANDCVVLSAAQHSHVSAVQSFDITSVDTVIQRRHEPKLVAASVFNLSPCSQRAPPLV